MICSYFSIIFSMIILNLILGLSFIVLLVRSSPFIAGLGLLLLTLRVRLWLALISSSWVGIVILIIYLGGLLMLFAYFLALTPHHKIEISGWPLFIRLLAWIHSCPSVLYLYPKDLISSVSSASLLFCLMFLLYGIVIVVQISISRAGPLRQFNYDGRLNYKSSGSCPGNWPHRPFVPELIGPHWCCGLWLMPVFCSLKKT